MTNYYYVMPAKVYLLSYLNLSALRLDGSWFRRSECYSYDYFDPLYIGIWYQYTKIILLIRRRI